MYIYIYILKHKTQIDSERFSRGKKIHSNIMWLNLSHAVLYLFKKKLRIPRKTNNTMKRLKVLLLKKSRDTWKNVPMINWDWRLKWRMVIVGEKESFKLQKYIIFGFGCVFQSLQNFVHKTCFPCVWDYKYL